MPKPDLACTICGQRMTSAGGWFLVIEDKWADRLKVLRWNNTLAMRSGIHCVCSAAHVRELVTHWMTMGSLDSPFAFPSVTAEKLAVSRNEQRVYDPSPVSSSDLLGELSVDRASLVRVLEENPQALASVLDALLKALRQEIAGSRSQEQSEGDELLTIV